ncbi:MAG: ATP-binding protein [Nitrospirae bacterium YQR-1]
MRRKIKIRYYLTSFAVVETVLVLLLLFFMNSRKDEILTNATVRLQDTYQSVFNNFSLQGQTIYSDISSRPEILKIISDADTANQKEKALLRSRLYDILNPFYEKLKSLDVVQLHFHLSDGTTFLRFNMPWLFDDNLTKVRYSINYILSEKQPVEGFEHGRYNSAFRYVFPITKYNVFIGSFETSIHFKDFKKNLFKIFPAEYFLIVNKEAINKEYTISALNQYTKTSLNGDYLIEPSELKNNDCAPLKKNNLEEILQFIKTDVTGNLQKRIAFSHLLKSNGKYYIISFVPVQNTEKRIGAYLVSVVENNDITLYNDFTLRLIAGTFFLVLIISLLYVNNKIIKHKKLIESDLKFLQLFLETIPNPVFFMDYSGKYKGCNSEFADILRLRKEDILGKGAYEILTEELAGILSRDDKKLMKTAEKQTYEARITYSDGRVHDVIIVKAPVMSYRRSYGIVGSLLDVTERKQMEQLLVNNARIASMGELITAIAHNWRQPLNEIGLTIADIEDAFEFGQLDKDYLRDSVQSAMNTLHSISNTINEFRSFYKPTEVPDEFEIGLAVEDTLKMFTEAIESSGISCISTLLKDIKVKGYESEFKQVFLSILNNAKDAVTENLIRNSEKAGSGRIEINMSRESNKKVTVTVADNGGGIPERVINRIFDPYFTTKMQGKGIGMGLYLGKIIIEHKMKGRLYAVNSGSGAVLTIELGY